MLGHRRCLGLLFLAVLLPAGCGKEAPVVTAPPTVIVSAPVSEAVVDYQYVTGRTVSSKSVELRARVTGYLETINFTPGDYVREGQLMFQIDDRSYKADLAKSEADLGLAEARYKRTVADYERAIRIRASNPGAISQQELDLALATRNEADAAVKAARAQIARDKLFVEWAHVRAPIDGLSSRNLIDVGNIVNANVTVLTTITAMDPMFAYFDVDEGTVLDIQGKIRDGKIVSARRSRQAYPYMISTFLGLLPLQPGNLWLYTDNFSIFKWPVDLGLGNSTEFPYEGFIDFVNNQLDPSTGTMKVRGIFRNEKWALTPGLFVRVRMPVGAEHPALLVSDRAILTVQGQKVVYVLNDKNEVRDQVVEVGPVSRGLRVIEKGLKANDRVIVNGLQRVRPGMVVDPKPGEMPRAQSAPSEKR